MLCDARRLRGAWCMVCGMRCAASACCVLRAVRRTVRCAAPAPTALSDAVNLRQTSICEPPNSQRKNNSAFRAHGRTLESQMRIERTDFIAGNAVLSSFQRCRHRFDDPFPNIYKMRTTANRHFKQGSQCIKSTFESPGNPKASRQLFAVLSMRIWHEKDDF